MKNPIAVVTGGAGFIGSLLVDHLIQDDYSVVVVDDFSSGRHENLLEAEKSGGNLFRLEEQDICSLSVTELIAGLKPDVIFHLAAQADVRQSVEDPILDAEVNILGTLRVLEGARLGGARKVVAAASGGTLYGEPDPSCLPLQESLLPNPLSPYGVSKATMIYYLSIYQYLHGLDCSALALSNVYGPRQDPHGEAGVVAIFADLLLSGEACKIYGTGDQTRDFVFVNDVVDAFLRASKSGGLGLINIGTGIETSVNELYKKMSTITNSSLDPIYEKSRVGELERSSLDPTLAKAKLNWIPNTSLLDGLSSTIGWFEQN